MLGAPVRRDLRIQNSSQPPILSRVFTPIQPTSILPQGGWLEEDMNWTHLNSKPSGFLQESESLKPDKLRTHVNPFAPSTMAASTSSVLHVSQGKGVEEVCLMHVNSYFSNFIALWVSEVLLICCRYLLDLTCKNHIFPEVIHQACKSVNSYLNLIPKLLNVILLGLQWARGCVVLVLFLEHLTNTCANFSV